MRGLLLPALLALAALAAAGEDLDCEGATVRAETRRATSVLLNLPVRWRRQGGEHA